MSLPTRQQRTLNRIEGGLTASDPAFTSLFVIFERLARDEAMPGAESVRPRPVADRVARVAAVARRLTRRPAARARALLLVPAALAAMACAITLAAITPGSGRSGAPGRPPARQHVVRACRAAAPHIRPMPC